MDIANLLREHANLLGINELELDEDNCCYLLINEEFPLCLEDNPSEECFFLYSPVCAFPDDEGLKVCKKLLEANLFGKGTGPAFFAFDERANKIVLMQRIENLATDFQTYLKHLETFISYLGHWQNELNLGPVTEEVKEKDAIWIKL